MIKRELSSKSFKMLAEVQDFVKILEQDSFEILENVIKDMSNLYSRVITLRGKNIGKQILLIQILNFIKDERIGAHLTLKNTIESDLAILCILKTLQKNPIGATTYKL